MRTHEVSGKLAGAYRVDLASSSWEGKRLTAHLCVDEENSCDIFFTVKVGDESADYSSLHRAVECYDEGEL